MNVPTNSTSTGNNNNNSSTGNNRNNKGHTAAVNMNLSSSSSSEEDDEDNDDEDEDDDDFGLGVVVNERASINISYNHNNAVESGAAAATASLSTSFPSDFDRPISTTTTTTTNDDDDDLDDDDDDDDEMVDWEDGGDIVVEDDNGNNDQHNNIPTGGSSKPNAGHVHPLRPLTLDLNSSSRDGKSGGSGNDDQDITKNKRRRRRRKVTYRYTSLQYDIQRYVDDYYKTHILCYIQHAIYVSSHCSQPLYLALAMSLIPTPWHPTNDSNHNHNNNIPTQTDVQHFMEWFQTTVGGSSDDDVFNARPSAWTRSSRRSSSRSSSTKSTTKRNQKVTTKNKKHNKKNQPGVSSSSSLSGNHHKRKRDVLDEYDNDDTTMNSNDVTADLAIGSSGMSYRFQEYCKYIRRSSSTFLDDQQVQPASSSPSSFSEYDHLMFFVTCCRALQWKVRYCVAIDSVQRDIRDDTSSNNDDTKTSSPFTWLLDNNNNNNAHHCRQDGASAVGGSGSSQQQDQQQRKLLCDAAKMMFLLKFVIQEGKTPEKVIVVNPRARKFKDFKIIMVDKDFMETKPPAKKTKKAITSKANKTPRKASTAKSDTSSVSVQVKSQSKKRSTTSSQSNPPSSYPKLLCWLEVLCRNDDTSSSTAACTSRLQPQQQRQSLSWVHVDPILGLIDRYEIPEVAFYSARTGRPFHRQRRQPIPYVVAVEHNPYLSSSSSSSSLSLSSSSVPFKVTDVTARYASSMIETTKARGPPQITDQRSTTTVNQWFATIVKSINHVHRPLTSTYASMSASSSSSSLDRTTKQHQQEHKSSGKTSEDAITIDMEDDSDIDDGDKKPAAANSVTPENHPSSRSSLSDSSSQGAKSYDGGQFIDTEALEYAEQEELKHYASIEHMPTSKAAFKKHPLVTIKSVLNSTEVIKPDAKKRSLGMFKGELIYRRTDVETALPARKWLYERRKVKESELSKPILTVKARKKPQSTSFKALKSYGVGEGNDGSETARSKQIEDASRPLDDNTKEHLYGSWQTDPWSPSPVGPNDPIPVNEYNNIELALINPGLVHIHLHKVASVAKKLQIPYAPCLVGFDHGRRGNGGGGGSTPTIRGIVVHEIHEQLLREAHAEVSTHLEQQEQENKQKTILKRWKRLLVGMLTKDELEREYKDD